MNIKVLEQCAAAEQHGDSIYRPQLSLSSQSSSRDTYLEINSIDNECYSPLESSDHSILSMKATGDGSRQSKDELNQRSQNSRAPCENKDDVYYSRSLDN